MENVDYIDDCIFDGTVFHKRFVPFDHDFSYKLSYIWIDLNKQRNLRLFKFNSLSLFSFYDDDFGSKSRSKNQKLINYLILKLSKHNIKNVGHIKILCLPRIVNYAFNPISIFVCFDNKKKQRAFIFEVKNTFGEKCAYLVDLYKIKGEIKKKKILHVSPFFEVKGEYRFFFSLNNKNVYLEILYCLNGQKQFLAKFSGKRCELTDKNLALLFLKRVYQNILVTFGIHIQALKLWFKGAIYINKPEPPKKYIDGESNGNNFDK